MLEPRLGTTLESLHEHEALLRAEIAALEQRRQRVWEIGEAGSVPPTEVRLRLQQVTDDRQRFEAELTTVLAEVERATLMRSRPILLEGVLRRLERTWANQPLELQQRAASALADVAGGFWIAPGRRGRGRRRIDSSLKTGLDSPDVDAEARHLLENMREVDTLRNVDMAQRKMDDSITKKFIQSITE
ncbi:MAG: hypothetical protein WB681_14525 [Candidatus Cybelea sp.]